MNETFRVNDLELMEECHGTIENLQLIATRLEADVKDLERAVISLPSAHEMLQQIKSSSLQNESAKENSLNNSTPLTPHRVRVAVPNFTPK